MNKNVLITKDNCLASLTAVKWASNKDVEVVSVNEVSIVGEMYGIGKFPALVVLGDYGVVYGQYEGYNEDKYNELINEKRATIYE